MLLSTIPSLYHLSKMSIQALNEGKQIFMDELPPFIIENGELTSNESKPIIIKKDGFDIIFDSTGQTTENDVRNHGNAIALLKDEFFVVNNQTGQNFSYSTFQDNKMENKDIDKFFNIHSWGSLDCATNHFCFSIFIYCCIRIYKSIYFCRYWGSNRSSS